MLFFWSPPAIPNGEIISYTITYNLTGLPLSVVVLNATQYNITGLNAYTFYEVAISASTIVGAGPSTLPLILRTDIASKHYTQSNGTVFFLLNFILETYLLAFRLEHPARASSQHVRK